MQTAVPMEIDLYGFLPIVTNLNPNFNANPFQQYQYQQHQQQQFNQQQVTFGQPQFSQPQFCQPFVDLTICKCIFSAQKNKALQQNEKNMYSVQHLRELHNNYNTILSDPSKCVSIDVFYNVLITNKIISCIAANTFTIN